MRLEAIHPGPELDGPRLDMYCAANHLELPPPLRTQLLDQNGGAPRADWLVEVDGHDKVVNSLFSANSSDLSAELAWNFRTVVGRIPAGFLPFADDPGGDLYLIELDEPHHIWFWDHECEGERFDGSRRRLFGDLLRSAHGERRLN